MAEYKFFIGKKGVLAYVAIILTKVNSEKQDFMIKARGNNITKAVDVALISIEKIKGIKIKNINVASEKIKNTKNETISLSTIEILIGG